MSYYEYTPASIWEAVLLIALSLNFGLFFVVGVLWAIGEVVGAAGDRWRNRS